MGAGGCRVHVGKHGTRWAFFLETSDARRVYGMAGRNGCGDDLGRRLYAEEATAEICEAGRILNWGTEMNVGGWCAAVRRCGGAPEVHLGREMLTCD